MDQVERVLLIQESLPPILKLGVDQAFLRLAVSANPADDLTWNVQSETTPSARHDAYRTLMTRLRPLETPSRNAAIDELDRWASISDGARNTHRVLGESELSRLDAHELASVGAHTVSHPLLAVLSPEQQRDEVDGSKRRLEELLGRRVTSFAYPFGGRDAYSQTTIGIVANSGFELACANIEGRVGRRTPPFEVPRFLVRDWDGDEFERRLRMWAEL